VLLAVLACLDAVVVHARRCKSSARHAPVPRHLVLARFVAAVGTDNPALTVTYSGFVNNDKAESLATPPTVTTTATKASAAGSYPIAVTGAASSNYTFTYVNGTMSVMGLLG